jgi:CubicO group peptidase (beta-lactamase class C family)
MKLEAGALDRLASLDPLLERLLRDSRVPGVAIAIVAGGEAVFARGYGYRDLANRRPMTSKTIYPIASTTKAMNATLVGMLVDQGLLSWDAPVQRYLPDFRLGDAFVSSQVTVRDLIVMRTGLPRHDWMWDAYPTDRRTLVKGLAFLERSAGFRERFQYNNLTAMTAGYLAEVVTGETWESLAHSKLLEPLGMTSTTFGLPAADSVSLSYLENTRRELILTHRLSSEVTAPSGGAIHSTVEDMTQWLRLNLADGCVANRRLLQSRTLKEIHEPCVLAGVDQGAISERSAYALGWFVDTCRGERRISHGGYLHDVESSVMLFPESDVGIVSFSNFGPVRIASVLNEQVLDLLHGRAGGASLGDKIKDYERKVAETRTRLASVVRVADTAPSHALECYAGAYEHPAYGSVEIRRQGQTLVFERGGLSLPLEHWHYDAWVAQESDLFPLHVPHAFDRSSRLLFETDADGAIAAFTIRLEPTVAPIRFSRPPSPPGPAPSAIAEL